MSLDISEVAAPAGLLRRHLLRSQQGQIYRIAWSPDGMRLAGPTIFGAVHIWDPQTGVLTQVLRGHTGATFCVSWAPDGASLASAADDRSVRIWNAAEGSLARVLTSDMSYLLCAAWAPDGRYLAVAGGSEYGLSCGIRTRARSPHFARSQCCRFRPGLGAGWPPTRFGRQ
jgi:WD40 repeat protein